jgi:4-amino-4-deoxy-L-arabinose transferase-like glycosyltransferase
MGFRLVGSGGSYPTAFVPPGLPFALSMLYRVVGHSPVAAVLLMCVFGALVPPLLRQLGTMMFGAMVGRTAGWIAVVHPLLVFFSGYVLTEPLFSVMLLASLLASVSWLKQPRAGRALGAGLVWGAAALTRPTALPLPLVVTFWAWIPLGLLLAPRERLRQVGLLLTGVGLVVLPWTLRNAVSLHAFVPITTGGGRSLLDANNAVVWNDPDLRGGATGILTTEPWATRFRGLSEVEVDRRAGREAVAFLVSHVGDWPRMALAKLARFWRWNSATPSTGRWFTGRSWLARALAAVDPLLLWSLGLFPLAAWGLVRTLRGSRRYFQLLPLWVLAAFSLGAVLYWGALRLRVPVEPLVVLYAGVGVSDVLWRARARRIGLALLTAQRHREP